MSKIMAPVASALDDDHDDDPSAPTSNSYDLEAILAKEEFLHVASTLKHILSDMPPTSKQLQLRL